MSEDKNEYIVIGEVTGIHGQKGALRVRVLTEFPERFKRGARFYIEGRPCTVVSAKPPGENVIITLAGVDTAEAAAKLRGKHLEIPEGERKTLPPGRYYHHDIIGLEVFTGTGESLGKVSEILSTGSNDIYVVRGNNREVLIPAVKDVIKEIDLARKCITIEAIEGLLN